MRLTLEMKNEFILVHERLKCFLYLKNFAKDELQNRIRAKFSQELYPYKIKFEQWFSETDVKIEKHELLRMLLRLEGEFSDYDFGESDDFGRYSQMGLQIEPNDSNFNYHRGLFLMSRHNQLGANKVTSSTDWDYIEYYRKAYEYQNEDVLKRNFLTALRKAEAKRDFYTGLIKEIKHLEQFDPTPNIELREAKWEVYKVTISNSFKCYNGYTGVDGQPLKDLSNSGHICNHRVLFQNLEGNINMGACFTDPVRDVYDIAWFGYLEIEMVLSLTENEGLVSEDQEFDTRSCFVELHRIGILSF